MRRLRRDGFGDGARHDRIADGSRRDDPPVRGGQGGRAQRRMGDLQGLMAMRLGPVFDGEDRDRALPVQGQSPAAGGAGAHEQRHAQEQRGEQKMQCGGDADRASRGDAGVVVRHGVAPRFKAQYVGDPGRTALCGATTGDVRAS